MSLEGFPIGGKLPLGTDKFFGAKWQVSAAQYVQLANKVDPGQISGRET
jgi:hypothetical protein